MINKLVLENLKHRPLRTLLSILAIAIQVTMVLTLVGLSRGMINDQARRTEGVGADIVIRPPASAAIGSFMTFSEKVLPFIEKQPHVAAATGVLMQPTGFLTTVTGLDLHSFGRLNAGFKYLKGGPFQNPKDVIVDDYYAREHKLHIGDTLEMLNTPWRVCGIVEPGMLARVVVKLDVLQEITANTGKLTMLYAKSDKPADTQSNIEHLRSLLKDYQIFSMEELTSQISVNSIPMLKQFIYVVIGLGVLIGFLVVFLSMYTAVLERTREIGILKALGASPGYVIGVLLRETTVLAVLGSIAGILLTYGTRWAIMTVTPGSLIQAIVPDWWPKAAAIAIVGALSGAAYPGWKAARQNTIEALSYD